MLKVLLVGLGGFVGAIARYGISTLAHRHLPTDFPFGTFIVNVLGCFLIGSLLYLVDEKAILTPNLRVLLVIGLLASFTTFSTFGFESLKLLGNREYALATLNVLGNVLLGIGAVWCGRGLARILSP